ncbi:MAG: phage tail assembly chaperone [Pseudomonadota bacterium]
MAWGTLLRAGVRELGLRPDEFWALTPAEFLLIAGNAPDSMTRAGLEALMARFPDKDTQNDGS